jgi:hypothetical protein
MAGGIDIQALQRRQKGPRCSILTTQHLDFDPFQESFEDTTMWFIDFPTLVLIIAQAINTGIAAVFDVDVIGMVAWNQNSTVARTVIGLAAYGSSRASALADGRLSGPAVSAGRPIVSRHGFTASPRISREFCWKRPALSIQRAQGMPGADAPAAARVV